MSYLVLARKYRPRTFEEVIGQDVVSRVLRGALDEDRLGHAYLLCGPRGTGKTTIARILAKCLNCEQGPTSTPCGTCDRCVAADDGTEVDIIELDAASHTGVDKVRELRGEVAYAPMRARTKVYIIDEVHMLSKGAFNALLKTLEEPPAHVVFLFATTEPHKVLDTILSRCQVLRLNALSEEQIAGRLEDVFRLEEIRPGEGVVAELARGARGGMRDALSMADRLLALAGSEPTLEDLSRLGGDAGTREADELLDRIESGDRPGILRALGELEGGELELVISLLERLRTSVVLAHCGEESPLVSGSVEERRAAVGRAERLGTERIELMMQELLRTRERMRLFGGQERTLLEVTLLDLCRVETTTPLAELEERLRALASSLGLSTGTEDGKEAPRSRPGPSRPAPEAPPPPTPPAPRPPPARDALWKSLLEGLRESHEALADLLGRSGRIREVADDAITIHFGGLSSEERVLVEDRRNRAACSRLLERAMGRPMEIHWQLPETRDGEVTPAAKPSRSSRGKSAPPEDGFTKRVADLFGGVTEDLP